MNLKEMCKSLRLAYVAEIYESIPMELSETFLLTLFEMEMRLREEAKFINNKSLEDYRWHDNTYFPRHLKKEELMSLSFIDHQQNVVLTGAPGTGKTHLAIGLGREACRKGKEVRFFRVSELV